MQPPRKNKHLFCHFAAESYSDTPILDIFSFTYILLINRDYCSNDISNCFSLQMKLASVKLAMKYMKRVSAEIEMAGGGPEEQELIVQGVKFAFRVHQVSE